jgi:hypothetical protein
VIVRLQAEGVDADAAAYLRGVRDEAARIPYVCTSRRRTVTPIDAGEAEANMSSSLSNTAAALDPPMMEWVFSVINNFLAAREEVHHEVCLSHDSAVNYLIVKVIVTKYIASSVVDWEVVAV